MLSKRTFSPIKSASPHEDDIDSPYGKQAKFNTTDGPGKNYFENINSKPEKEEKEDNDEDSDDDESLCSKKEEDNSESLNRAKTAIMSFLQLTQKVKEKNFLSQKELKTRFKVNFTAFPNTDEILRIFNKILKRVTLTKTQKRNWYQEDIILLLWIIRRYSCYKNKHPDNLLEEDWLAISEMIPVKSHDQCKFKFLTLKKVDLYKYPWTKEEDKYLKQIMKLLKNSEKGQHKIKWGDVAKRLNILTQSSIFRSGKLCRERWNNYLNPELKKCEWSMEEDSELMRLVLTVGKKWSEISKQLPGRNENAVKNRFFSLLRKERKRQNQGKMNYDAASDNEGFSNIEETTLINSILAERQLNKKQDTESSLQEIKLTNLTASLDKCKLNTISRIGNPNEIMEPKPINIKKESIEEETKTFKPPSPPLNTNQNNMSNANPNFKTQFPQSAHSIPNPNPFIPPQGFGSNPFLPNILFQNIPKIIQMNTFGYFNPYFPNQPQNYPNQPQNYPYPPRFPEPEIDKLDHPIYNHPVFQNQMKVENPMYNQTPHTLKNNLDPKRDPPSFSTHPLVVNSPEKNEVNNSIESLSNIAFQNIMHPESNTPARESPGDFSLKLKIRNGLELNPSDYSNCLYSVVNLQKRELFLFTPLSNPSESNKSFLSAFFNLGPNDSPQDDYISFNSGSRSFTKNELANQSFRNMKKNKTCNSFVSSQQSSNNIINLSNSPPHSPKKDSKFKEINQNYFPNE